MSIAMTRAAVRLVLIVAPIVVWTTSAQLPARVATHFGGGGLANGLMTARRLRAVHARHDDRCCRWWSWRAIALAATASRRRGCRSANREHWLAPQRRAATMAALATCGLRVRRRAGAVPDRRSTSSRSRRTRARRRSSTRARSSWCSAGSSPCSWSWIAFSPFASGARVSDAMPAKKSFLLRVDPDAVGRRWSGSRRRSCAARMRRSSSCCAMRSRAAACAPSVPPAKTTRAARTSSRRMTFTPSPSSWSR